MFSVVHFLKTYTVQKVSVFGVILLGIFPAFSHIRAEYGEYLSVFRPNVGKMRTRITPNTGTFYAVIQASLNLSMMSTSSCNHYINWSYPSCLMNVTNQAVTTRRQQTFYNFLLLRTDFWYLQDFSDKFLKVNESIYMVIRTYRFCWQSKKHQYENLDQLC